MPTKQLMLDCITCEKPALHIQQAPNHILHLLLSLISCGLWIIIWILVSIAHEKAECTVCGTVYNRKAFK